MHVGPETPRVEKHGLLDLKTSLFGIFLGVLKVEWRKDHHHVEGHERWLSPNVTP